MKIGPKLSIGFGIQIVLTVVLGLFVLFSMNTVQQKFSAVVEEDSPILAKVHHLSKLVIDMETGQRGYCITLKESFLEPYTSATREFDIRMEELKGLLEKRSIDDKHLETLEKIEGLIAQWHEEAAEPEIAMARKVSTHKVNAELLQEILRGGKGKKLIDDFMKTGHEVEVFFSSRGDWEGAFAVEIIEKSMADREDSERGFLITGREEFLEKYIKGEQQKMPQYFVRLRSLIADRGYEEELSAKVDRLEQLTHDWTKEAAEPEIAARREMNKHPETLKDVAALLEAGTGKDLMDDIRAEFDRFVLSEEAYAANSFTLASGTTTDTRRSVLALLVIATLLGISIAVVITHSVVRPLAKLSDGALRIGEGKLETHIEIESSDEIGHLTRSFNSMTDKLAASKADLEQEMAERKKEEQRNRVWLEASPACTKIVDLEFNLQYMSSAAVIGLNNDDISSYYGKPYPFDFYPDSFKKLMTEKLEFVVNTGEKTTLEASINDIDGRELWYHSTLVPVNDDEGRLDYILVVSVDVTERKWAELNLKQSEQRFRKYYEMGIVGMSVTSTENKWLDVNPRLCEMLGYSRDELRSMTWTEITHPDDLATGIALSDRVLAGEIEKYSYEKRYIKKDGSTIDVLVSVQCMRKDDGSPDYFMDLVHDLTEQKRIKKHESELEQQLLQAQKMESLGTLAGGIAHDFNNILQAILGFSKVAQENTVGDTELLISCLEEIDKGGHRAADLVEQILTFSRKSDVKTENLKLPLLIEEALKFIRSSMPSTIQIESDIDPDCPQVVANATQIHQVVTNLCTNAMHAMEEGGGTLSVVLKTMSLESPIETLSGLLQPGDYIQLSIADTGVGIAPELIHEILDPFFTTKEVGKGTGLGLAMTHGIVSAMAGGLTIESEVGKGTTVRLTLPVVTESDVDAQSNPPPQEMLQGHEHIMLVDDEVAITKLTAIILKKQGFTVDVFNDVESAIKAARDNSSNYNLAILDYTMPGKTGIELAKELETLIPGMPVVIATGMLDNSELEQSKSRNIVEIIKKPYHKEELMTIINRAL